MSRSFSQFIIFWSDKISVIGKEISHLSILFLWLYEDQSKVSKKCLWCQLFGLGSSLRVFGEKWDQIKARPWVTWPKEALILKIQWRSIAMVHLKCQFWFSSNLERTKNSRKTSHISFESPDCRHLKSWRFGAWHYHWPATPTLCEKFTF